MKIVVRGTNWIGDAVMTIPALRELRRIFAGAEIILHTRSWAEAIFRDADFIDEILSYDASESTLKDVLEQAKVLRDRNFDLAVLFTGSFASALTARFGAIPERFGYSRDARRIFLTHPIRIPEWKNTRHEVYYYLNLIAEIEKIVLDTETVSRRAPDISLPVSETRRRRARALLADCGVELSRKTVALGVGSTNSLAKRWLPDRFAALNDRIQRDLGANVILIGSKDEKDVSDAVMQSSTFKPVRLTGKTTLDDAVAILSEVDLLVSNDMGLAHVAPAVGTQTAVIFGPTNPETTRPFSDLAQIIRRDVECSPCMLRECPIDHRCMTGLSVEEVFTVAASKLASARSAGNVPA
jgi:heptosyltransferase-2